MRGGGQVLSLGALLLAFISLTGCGGRRWRHNPGIEVTKQPTKTQYAIGEDLNVSGIEVTATYYDGTTEIINVTEANISGFNSTTAGKKTLTVSYDGKTAPFTVWVCLEILSAYHSYDASGTFDGHTVYEYDPKINLTKQTNYDASGIWTIYSVNEYDSNNNPIKESGYYPTGLYGYYTYEYNPTNNNLIKKSRYPVVGVVAVFDRYAKYEYNSTNNNLIKQSAYAAPATLVTYIEYEYDGKGRKAKESTFTAPSSLSRYVVYTYWYVPNW